MDHGKTYVVGAMTSFKDSFINTDTHLLGVCLKPTAFSNFYKYVPQHELINSTVQFDKAYSFDLEKIKKVPTDYLNSFFIDRIRMSNKPLTTVIANIHHCKGQISIYELAKQNHMTVRQLERNFKIHIGTTPKEYARIVRFQSALTLMTTPHQQKSLSDIAFECGFFDQAHLANEVKHHTGLTPSQF